MVNAGTMPLLERFKKTEICVTDQHEVMLTNHGASTSHRSFFRSRDIQKALGSTFLVGQLLDWVTAQMAGAKDQDDRENLGDIVQCACEYFAEAEFYHLSEEEQHQLAHWRQMYDPTQYEEDELMPEDWLSVYLGTLLTAAS